MKSGVDMNIKSIVLLGVVSMMAACATTPVEMTAYDSEVSEYRIFLSGLDRQVNDMSFDPSNTSRVFDILQVRDEIYHVMGGTKSFDEFSETQYAEFRALSKELYRRMCSEQQFVAERAYLYDMLMSPNFDRQVAGI